MNKKPVILFDMDGVLVDTPKLNWDTYNHLLAPHGVHFDIPEIRTMLGMSLKDQIDIWNKKYDLSLDYEIFSKEAHEVRNSMTNSYAEIVHRGAKEFLQGLKQNNFTTAVVTSAPAWLAQKQLTEAGVIEYFDTIVTGDDTEKRKPDPEPYLKAAEKLGVEPGNCIVIEDAKIGIESGSNAGMKTIGLITDFNTKESLDDADLSIQEFSELSEEVLLKLVS